ncbi:MAG: T9SS type A sorting domain-containing protein [Saprospiraceae bacterium]
MKKIINYLSAGVLCASISSQTCAQVDSFFVVGVHPTAVLQPTISGKQLKTLFPWKGKLYSGYGDYNDNTGPIDIFSFSTDSLKFIHESIANTEAVYNYKAINGMLYAPAIDRRGSGDFAKMDSNGIWGNYKFGSYNSEHVYDAAGLNDSVLFMVGSQSSNAAVWKSSNNGRTWNQILADSAISGKSGDFARFYFAGVYNGNLYVQARDYYGSLHPSSKVYNGSTWSNGPSLFPLSGSLGWRPEVFAGKLVYRSWEPGNTTPLRSFDGINNAWVNSLYVFDCVIDSNYFYALVDSGYGVLNIRRTNDLVNWQNLMKVPYTSRSLAILNDKLFVGTKDSKIMQYTKPVSLLNPVTTFIKEVTFETDQIRIYPNPAKQNFNISLPKGNCDIVITDLAGRNIYKLKNISDNLNIDSKNFNAGIYIVQVILGRKILNERLIIFK